MHITKQINNELWNNSNICEYFISDDANGGSNNITIINNTINNNQMNIISISDINKILLNINKNNIVFGKNRHEKTKYYLRSIYFQQHQLKQIIVKVLN